MSLLVTRGTGPSSGLIAGCCGKAGYGDAFFGAQSCAQKITPGSKNVSTPGSEFFTNQRFDGAKPTLFEPVLRQLENRNLLSEEECRPRTTRLKDIGKNTSTPPPERNFFCRAGASVDFLWRKYWSTRLLCGIFAALMFPPIKLSVEAFQGIESGDLDRQLWIHLHFPESRGCRSVIP